MVMVVGAYWRVFCTKETSHSGGGLLEGVQFTVTAGLFFQK
jgi:hypothetical protein